MDNSGFGAPPSGLPPLAWLSGLNLGQAGLSGAQDQSMSGATGRGGGGLSGMGSEGMGLDELSALLASQQAGGDQVGAVGGGATPFSLTSLGQAPSGATGGYGVAGQVGAAPGTSSQGASAASQAAGSADPLAVIQKILGLAAKGVSTVGQLTQGGGTAEGQQGGIGTSDVNRSIGTASPTTGTGGYQTADTTGQIFGDLNSFGQAAPGPYGTPVTELTLSPAGLTPEAAAWFKQAGVDPNAIAQAFGEGSQNFADLLVQSGLSPEEIAQLAPGQGFEQTAIGGSLPPNSGYATAGNTSSGSLTGGTGVNGMGALQSGLGTTLGLLNLIQGIRSGNIPQDIAGALQGVGGITGLLNATGYGSQLGSQIGGAAGGLGGLLGIAGGIQGLVEGGNTGQALTQLGGGALGAYGGAQSLGLLPAAGGGITGAFASVAPEAAAALANSLAAISGTATTAASAGAPAISAALSSALAGVGAAAAPVIMAIMSYIGESDKRSAQNSWANLGKPLTTMQERALNAGNQASNMFQQLKDLGITDPNILKQALGAGGNALNTFYDTMTLGPYKNQYGPLSYYDRTKQDPSEFFRLLGQTKEGEFGLIQQLANQGVPLSDLAGIPASQSWGNLMRRGYAGDVSLPQLGAYQTGYQSGLPMGGQAGSAGAASFGSGYLDQPAFNAATGSPFLSMVANLNPEMYTALGGQVNMQNPIVQEYIAAQAQAAAMQDAAAYEAFTSGGGGM